MQSKESMKAALRELAVGDHVSTETPKREKSGCGREGCECDCECCRS
jgi:hypothetical protein